MFFGIFPGSERCLVQRVDHVADVQPVFSGYGFDCAVVTRTSKAELLEKFHSLGVLLLHIPDYHVAANQVIESKHRRAPRMQLMHPAYQNTDLRYQ